MLLSSPIIEIALGLVLLYLVLSLVCTSVNEYIAQMLGLRAENLVEAIYGMFSGADRHKLAEDIYDHPDVRSICRKQFGIDFVNGLKPAELHKLPSAISPTVFSGALADLLRKNEAAVAAAAVGYAQQTIDHFEAMLKEGNALLVADTAKAATDHLPAPAGDKFDYARAAIEAWYGEVMNRAGGWYKKRAQVMSFLVSFGLVFALNADTVMMYRQLAHSPVERAKLDAMANQVKRSTDKDQPGEIEVSESLKSASFEFLGWTSSSKADDIRRMPVDSMGWLVKLLGLAISAFAVSLGAPFWFDVLSKVMTVRSGGDPNKKKGEVAAK